MTAGGGFIPTLLSFRRQEESATHMEALACAVRGFALQGREGPKAVNALRISHCAARFMFSVDRERFVRNDSRRGVPFHSSCHSDDRRNPQRIWKRWPVWFGSSHCREEKVRRRLVRC